MKDAVKALVGALGETVGAAKSIIDGALGIVGAASTAILGTIRKALADLSK